MQDTEPQKNDGVSRTGGAMKIPDLVFVDIETTGLNPEEHEIIEIAAVRVSQVWKPGEKPVFTLMSEWSTKVHPKNIQSADPASLRINGYTVTGWSNAVELANALPEFSRMTEGAIMVAHNVAFDAGFIDSALREYGMLNLMHYHRLDTVSMAYAKLHSTPDVNRYSLMELSKYFGIHNDNPHSALADARACYELFKKLIEL